ncbi:binding partner of ACD11 1 isoform X1 [Daucus carota subsp. sativus]|uniref:binding partner of ACD11 1 isoform X1 n=1 Tax=Daucus carota subsp. sativus TaxID=79200 RepID=UPI0030832749
MDSRLYTIEVTSLSPAATEKDIQDFFAFCGKIEHVEIIRAGDLASTAYVSFKYAHALETAVLLSGATILDRPVCITNWGQSEDEFNIWNRPTWKIEDESSENQHVSEGTRSVPSAGEAMSLAQDVVKAMVSKGYVLGVGALSKAKSFDESHQVSATATAKVAELSEKIGLTDKIYAGVGAVKSVDERYHIYDTTKSAVAATGRTAAAATNTVVNSSYFSKGALWMSDALSRAAKAAADLGNRDTSK